MSKFYNRKVDDVLHELGTDTEKGLTPVQIKAAQQKYGKNEFTQKEEETLFDKIKDSLSEPMILILIAAAIISFVIGESHDAIGIVGAIAVGVGIGLVTEGKSKKAAEALSKMSSDIEVKVLRNGHVSQVHKSELIPGDIVYLETGDMVPADGRLVSAMDLKVREDMLTGESDDVKKEADLIVEMVEVPNGDTVMVQEPIPAHQKNMVFGGTLIASGRGTMVVTSIGDTTEMGKIAQNLNDEGETPLQIKLGNLGGMIAKASSAIAGLLFIFMTGRLILVDGLNVDMSGFMPFMDSIAPIKTAFTVCVALIVAAVPEGLPTMINMTLAITMQKMSKINALVTKKEACETIGSVSVICSDKTGTLTQNRMTVAEVVVDDKDAFAINCVINSTADIDRDENGQLKYLGSATECALLVYHDNINYREARANHTIVAQEQFSSATKMMSTTIDVNGIATKYIKGAPEVVMDLCDMTDEAKAESLKGIEKLQRKSMRALGFAKEVNGKTTWTGYVGIKDPLRAGVSDSVRNLKKAGVATKMLTGDNIVTARAIGEELGLLDNGMRAVEATYIDTLTDEELRKEIETIAIVARSKPDTKMRVVQALQANGEVVAVTGDGINDAPALSKADVGVAMGIAGTEVSKGAADIILTDDSFSTIEKAVKWGRGIYENFQRFVQFQLTVNIIAFLVAIVCTVTGKEMPFTTIQLLWVNIIMDGPPALALGLEPVRNAVLNRRPTDRNANIISKPMMISIIANALLITSIILLQQNFNFLNVSDAQMGTVLFAIFAFSALFNALNAREFGSDSILPNFFSNKLVLQVLAVTGIAQIFFTNIFQDFFNSVALDVVTWVKVLATASIVVISNEIVKLVVRKIKR